MTEPVVDRLVVGEAEPDPTSPRPPSIDGETLELAVGPMPPPPGPEKVCDAEVTGDTLVDPACE